MRIRRINIEQSLRSLIERCSRLNAGINHSAQVESDFDVMFEQFIQSEEWNFQLRTLIAVLARMRGKRYNMLTDEIEADEPDKVTDLANKLLRKRLTKNHITLYGLQRDSKFDRLFTKIDKYSNDMDLHTAIAMAVKSSSKLIDDDFDDFIRRKVDERSPSDEAESSSGDSSDGE